MGTTVSMDETENTSGRKDARDTALGWYVRLTSGEAGEADWAAHAEWLAADPANLAAFTSVQVQFDRMDSAAEAVRAHYADAMPAPVLPAPARRVARRTVLLAGAFAGLAAIVAGISLWPWSQATPTRYATARGEVRQVTLADGSTVNLDTDTAITVAIDDGRRVATLDHGRAIFDIRHEPSRPFIVNAGRRRIHVLGTRFEVSTLDDSLSVTVARGRVGVTAQEEDQPILAQNTASAGERLVYLQGGSIPHRETVDAATVGHWSEGWLSFVATPLKTVLEEANRYLPGDLLHAGGPAVAEMTFTGSLQIRDGETLARNLADFMSLDIRREGDHFILEPREASR